VIESAQLSFEEKELLLQHFRKSQSVLIRERAQAILLSGKGFRPYEIAQVIFRDEKTVREWLKAFTKERIASLFPKYLDNENAAKLTRIQKDQIRQVLAQPPSEYGLPKEFWEVKSLRKYLLAEFGIEYKSDNSYRFIFKLHNYSFHLPAKFDLKRDEELVRQRLKEIREIISPFLADNHWEVLAADESRLIWEAITRRAWLPKGKKTVIKVQRSKDYQNFFGCLNLKTGKPHLFGIPWQNGEEIIRILNKLKKIYLDKQLCLIWDNASFHKTKKLKEKLKTSLKAFYLLNLPPYAPDTNPQEHIWEYAKDEIANQQCVTMEKMTKRFKEIVIGRNYPYQI
jgi:transposase